MPNARILIVEDHPTMREAMRLVLEGEGFEIDEAADGEEGRGRAMAIGADEYFTKPFSPITLLNTVEQVLSAPARAPEA